jgi:hypothetical protein
LGGGSCANQCDGRRRSPGFALDGRREGNGGRRCR